MKKIIFTIISIVIIQTISLQNIFAQSTNSVSLSCTNFDCFACAPASATVSISQNYILYTNSATYGNSSWGQIRLKHYVPNAITTTSYTVFTSMPSTGFLQGSKVFTVNRGNNLTTLNYITVQGSNNNGSTWTDLSTWYGNPISTGIYPAAPLGLNININGLPSVAPAIGALPATILRCASGSTLNLTLPLYLKPNGTVKIEKGNFDPLTGTFWVVGSAVTYTLTASSGPYDLLAAPFNTLNLGEWSGYIRITSTLLGECSNLTNDVRIYNLDGNVEFKQKKLITCPNTTIEATRYTDINFANNTVGSFTAPQCSLQGWMGRKSCGITVTASLTGVTSSRVKVDKINNVGGVISAGLFDITYPGLFADYLFNDISSWSSFTGVTNASTAPDNWFKNSAIPNSDLFRITVSATSTAGTCSSIGYFKLQAGSNSINWRTPQGYKKIFNPEFDNDEEFSSTGFVIYPNPADNQLQFDFNIDENNGSVTIYDVVGRNVNTTKPKLGANVIDITKLKSGVYIAVLELAGQKYTTRFTKN
jgi:hypothetical protein